MRRLLRKIKPASGLSHFFHLALVVVLPIVIFVLVRLDFVQLALSVIVLSKWRMLAVRPRFWAANVRANAVDMMVGLSVVFFMAHAPNNLALQLMWVVLYAVWLIAIKPASSARMITLQAALSQLAALMALFLAWTDGPLYGLTLLTGIVCFMAAHHFFDAFDEPYAKLLSYVWGYFGAALAWLLGHWLIFYGVISQSALLLSVIGYGLAGMYYLDHEDRLSMGVRRQLVFIMLAVVVVILAFSDWGDKVV
jgi:hypothetical protein